MGNGNPKLVEFLIRGIASDGPMPFDEFMRSCLYHPDWGYYASGENHTGRKGDFYTNVSVGAVFGQLMTMQFVEMWERMGSPENFTLVEQGANDGRFACDVLECVYARWPKLGEKIRYAIIEPQPRLEAKQRETLKNFQPQISWYRDLVSVGHEAITGVYFSNELPDSFPVKRVVCRGGVWMDSCVVWDEKEECFKWVEQPLDATFADRVKTFPAIEGYSTEICPAADEWIGRVADILKKGFVITVDYGYPEELYRDPARTEGTLLCYYQHRQYEDPLGYVGEQDITAHVDFTSLEKAGGKAGLKTLGLVDQHKFLVGVAEKSLLEAEKCCQMPAFDMRGFKTLMHPEMLGTTFKFLVQSKNLGTIDKVSGLGHLLL